MFSSACISAVYISRPGVGNEVKSRRAVVCRQFCKVIVVRIFTQRACAAREYTFIITIIFQDSCHYHHLSICMVMMVSVHPFPLKEPFPLELGKWTVCM